MIRCFFCLKRLETYNIARLRSELSLGLYVYVCDDCLLKYGDLILEVVKRGEKVPYIFNRDYRNSAGNKVSGRGRYYKGRRGGGKGKEL